MYSHGYSTEKAQEGSRLVVKFRLAKKFIDGASKNIFEFFLFTQSLDKILIANRGEIACRVSSFTCCGATVHETPATPTCGHVMSSPSLR